MGYAILDQRGGDSLTATTLDGYSLLADTTVSSATTTVNFTGLNIGWGDELLLVSDIVGNTSYPDYSIFVNGNTTQSNYYTQELFYNGTSVSSGRGNGSYFSYSELNNKTLSKVNIKLTNNGYFVFQSEMNRLYGTGSAMQGNKKYGTSTFTITSITQLTVTATISNAIGIGSRFQLYKSGGGASRTWAIT